MGEVGVWIGRVIVVGRGMRGVDGGMRGEMGGLVVELIFSIGVLFIWVSEISPVPRCFLLH